MKHVNILDTTLRDGSYTINFSFTQSDTTLIAKELEHAGLEFIEIGHGVGLGASEKGYGKAIQTDEEYLISVENILKKAKFGMFCIPKIASLESIDMAAKHGMGFIRIGTNVTEIESSKEFIKRAKDYGMFVASNFMKSYVLPPEEYVKKVLKSITYGTDMIYVVDSAGGMFGEDITAYYQAIRQETEIPLGYHGHNNLGLANANSLLAADLGFDYVDSSLQGLGRSSGNASTELIVAALLKKNYDLHIDLKELIEIGQRYVKPLLNTRGIHPLDIIAGFSDFHSSYMHHIQEFSAKYQIDPALLIIEWSKIDKVNVNREEMEKTAQKIQKEDNVFFGKYNFNKYYGREQE